MASQAHKRFGLDSSGWMTSPRLGKFFRSWSTIRYPATGLMGKDQPLRKGRGVGVRGPFSRLGSWSQSKSKNVEAPPRQRQSTKDLGFRGIGQADPWPRLHFGSSDGGSRGGDAERL